MKKLLFLLFASVGAMAQTSTVKFSAEIKNPNSTTLTFSNQNGDSEEIEAKSPGKFSGTLTIESADFYELNDGAEYAIVFLKPGFDLKVTIDAKQFDETIKFSGTGAKENNYLAARMLSNEQLKQDIEKVSSVEEANKKIEAATKKLAAQLADKDIDTYFKDILEQQLDIDKEQLTEVAQKIINAAKMKGQPSPGFDFENAKGGKTTLASLKGKYVYIDVWATWCGPCRREIPYLKEVEEKYHGKNIQFVSISIDDQEDHDKWKKMVTDQQLGGIQLFAENAWQSEFTTAYGIDSIPRFILIDPKGNVVETDAKRPSDPELTAQLDKLLK